MNHFDRCSDGQNRPQVLLVRRKCGGAKRRPDTLAAIHGAVAHRLVNALRRFSVGWEEFTESGIDSRTNAMKKCAQLSVHCPIQMELDVVVPNRSSEESLHAVPLL